MTWLAEQASGTTPLQRTVGLRPELAPLLDDFVAATWSATTDPVTLELCRLRIAQVHRDRAQFRVRHQVAIDAGLTEDQVAALDDVTRSPLFTDHQRRCIGYAEQYVVDVHGITDADAAAVREGMTDDQFVAFTVALGLFDGIGRMRLVLGVDDDAPTDDLDEPVIIPVSPAS